MKTERNYLFMKLRGMILLSIAMGFSLHMHSLLLWCPNTNSEIKKVATVQAVVIFFSVSRLECPGEGPLLNWTRIKARGKNAATIRVVTLAIIEVRPEALGQIWHPPGVFSI